MRVMGVEDLSGYVFGIIKVSWKLFLNPFQMSRLQSCHHRSQFGRRHCHYPRVPAETQIQRSPLLRLRTTRLDRKLSKQFRLKLDFWIYTVVEVPKVLLGLFGNNVAKVVNSENGIRQSNTNDKDDGWKNRLGLACWGIFRQFSAASIFDVK